jgi:hypothetical protein
MAHSNTIPQNDSSTRLALFCLGALGVGGLALCLYAHLDTVDHSAVVLKIG